ncbi:hypothetical protein VTL71DRAFT_14369 [Oculimacula yallundae]|uniref:Gpi anchored protein n=1 Tax=Oculimacula yallundae TaxID=86028 RepID=A0ABR4CI89_9HELO
MQLIKLSVLALLSSYVAAQDIDNNDVPLQCRSVCASVVTLSETCDRQNNDNDSGFINCVCTGSNAASIIPACEACVANFDRNDGADNDVNDLVRSCSFSRASYTSMTGPPTPSASGVPGTAAGPGPLTTLTGSQSSIIPAVTGSASSAIQSLSSVAATNSQQAASASSAIASLSSAATVPTPTSAASANSIKAVGIVGALFWGFIGLA